MSHRCLTFLRTGAFGVVALLATAAGRAAAPSPYPVVALESGGELRAEVHPATAEDGETVILEAPGLLIELPRAAVDEATPPDALLVEYAERAAKAADTAPEQFALAEWCEEQDLDPERQFHLERTIAIDPEHEAARKALGYNKIDGKWIHPEQSMIDAGYVRYRGRWHSEMELERILAEEQAEKVRGDYLRSMRNWRRQLDGRRGQEMVLNFQRVTDPLAVSALRKMLDGEEVEAARRIYVDTLGRIPGGEANALLAEIAVNDRFGTVRASAIDRLVERQATSVTPWLISQLYAENSAQINRAALVLGRLGDQRAVAALIDALVTEHKQTVTTGGGGGGIGAAFGGGNAGLSAGSSTRVVNRTMNNGEVLAALAALTGESRFGYDEDLWKRWYSDQRNVKNINLRELPR